MSLMCSRMVCVPCILLPILTVIYFRFIQPFILRFVPESWRARVDSILYPTCPVNLKNRPKATNSGDVAAPQECPCAVPTSTEEKSEEAKKEE